MTTIPPDIRAALGALTARVQRLRDAALGAKTAEDRATALEDLHRALRRLEGPPGRPPRPGVPDLKAEVQRLRGEGLSIRRIAEATGVSKSQVGAWLKAAEKTRNEG